MEGKKVMYELKPNSHCSLENMQYLLGVMCEK